MNAYEKLLSTETGKRAFYEEKAVGEITELICGLLESEQISGAELAKRLGVTPGRVSQILDGETDMKVSTVTRVLMALGRTLEVSQRRIGAGASSCLWFPSEMGGDPAWSRNEAWKPTYQPAQNIPSLKMAS